MGQDTANCSDVLTPETLRLLERIVELGSFAAAARASGLVPSTLTYRVGQIEEALDVLLFDRTSRQARPTEACHELLLEGRRLVADADAIAARVRRVAQGWERSLTIAVDAIISRAAVIDMCEAFFLLNPPTRIRLRYESLNGTLDALTSGRADLALGVVADASTVPDLGVQQLGSPEFIYVVAPHHPLAKETEPLRDDVVRHHRAVAVADSTVNGTSMTIRLLGGQDVFTVPDMVTMRDALRRGLGVGYLPTDLAKPYIDSGQLVAKRVERAGGQTIVHYVWRKKPLGSHGKALRWWLTELRSPYRRSRLLGNVHEPEEAQARRQR